MNQIGDADNSQKFSIRKGIDYAQIVSSKTLKPVNIPGTIARRFKTIDIESILWDGWDAKIEREPEVPILTIEIDTGGRYSGKANSLFVFALLYLFVGLKWTN